MIEPSTTSTPGLSIPAQGSLLAEQAFREGYRAGYSNGSDDSSRYNWGGGSKHDSKLQLAQDEAWDESDAKLQALKDRWLIRKAACEVIDMIRETVDNPRLPVDACARIDAIIFAALTTGDDREENK